ncbi:MAG TPA: hypothetical protein VHW24_28150 [Bryobacteraceae bacterium]|jgi:hypothetical protein|nr:hypothetical protein [Bryobacteraceae bacterium]
MPESEVPSNAAEVAAAAPAPGGGRGPDEVALDMMKFIAVTTGYGKGSPSSAGFSGKPSNKSAEEQADVLIELFKRCRRVVKED